MAPSSRYTIRRRSWEERQPQCEEPHTIIVGKGDRGDWEVETYVVVFSWHSNHHIDIMTWMGGHANLSPYTLLRSILFLPVTIPLHIYDLWLKTRGHGIATSLEESRSRGHQPTLKKCHHVHPARNLGQSHEQHMTWRWARVQGSHVSLYLLFLAFVLLVQIDPLNLLNCKRWVLRQRTTIEG